MLTSGLVAGVDLRGAALLKPGPNQPNELRVQWPLFLTGNLPDLVQHFLRHADGCRHSLTHGA